MRGPPEQLPLGLRLRADATFANFVAGGAAAATVQALRRWLEQAESGVFYLCGAPVSGRSHLLQAACNACPGALYLPLRDCADANPTDLLENLEHAPLLCLDDIDAVSADSAWAEALFHLCNRLLTQGGKLLASAELPAAALVCALPDLQSRLGWGGSFRVPALDDEGRRELLQLRARERGFVLSDDVTAYILQRHARDIAALLRLIDELDRRSLAEQKRITIPFVKQLFPG